MANPEFRKTILIGLGGAGQQIVLRTKRFFLDTYGALPPSVKLFCLDTDDESMRLRSAVHDGEYVLDPHEFLHMQVINPREFIDAGGVVSKWFIKPVPVGSITNGAGAVRENGRLAFFYHIKEINRRLDNMLASLNDQQLFTQMSTARELLGANTNFRLSNRDTEIYVCGSIAGGTGSGTFLDMGILLRDMRQNSLIHGFFLLPWLYRNKAFAHRVKPNGYAALAELDNMQSIMYGEKDFAPYEITYGDRHVKVEQAPYDLFHLIDGRNEHGENIDDVEALCETIANAIFLSMGSMSYKVSSVVDNLKTFIVVHDPRVWEGRYARYSSLGVSSIHYPAVELHRLLSAANALRLCQSAINEIETGQGETTSGSVDNPQIAQEVDSFLKQINLYASNVKNQIGGYQGKITVQLENYEISDAEFPALLKARIDGEKKKLQKNLDAMHAGVVRVFRNGLKESLVHRLKTLVEDAKKDSRSRREWAILLADHLTQLRDRTAEEVVQTTERVTNLQKSSDALLETAAASMYIPVFGGNRKRAALDWAEQIADLLNASRELENLRQEQRLYEDLLAELEFLVSTRVPQVSEITDALQKTEGSLRSLISREQKSLELLRGRPNHVLLGYGNIVVIHEGKGSLQSDEIVVSFEEFKSRKAINTHEVYLDTYRENPHDLVKLFHDYCGEELGYVLEMTAEGAMEKLAEESGDADAYKQQQFDSLFRLSSALWSFDRGRITGERAEQMDKIINIGYRDHEAGDEAYGQIVKDAKTRFHISTDVACSTTGDPYRIWMLNYAAAIPAYFINGLREARKIYQEEITPTYHIGKDLEMNVPDLFPLADTDNKALRVLAMAIIPGIDVIHDEKLTKGHKFTCEHQRVRDISYDQSRVWFLFRDMYNDVKDYDETRARKGENLLDILSDLLVARVSEIEPSELKSCIERYIEKVEGKLDKRNFSRLYSARLTYQEIKYLKRFLDINPVTGFTLDIDKYING